nr:replicative DNA helicase [Prevotella sp.]
MSDNRQRNNVKKGASPIDPNFAHVQPQAVEIERVVLGALMVDSDAFSVVSELLKPETFYEPRHQKIYEAIRNMNMDERPVDIMTLNDELSKMGEIDKVGGVDYLMEISSQVASAAHVESHARILAEKYMQRQLIHFAGDIETKAYDSSVDVDELMQQAEGSLFQISQNNMKQDFTQVAPVVKNAVEILQRAASNKGGLTGIPTGYVGMDEITSGWQASDLVIIAGRPAMGKTSFALSIAKNVAVDYGVPIGFFSLEMNNVQLVNRLISNVCEVSGRKILNGQLDPSDWERLDKRIGRLTNAPIYVDDTPGLSVFELRTKARRLVREKGVKIIMIDYLQLMNANGMKFGSRQEEVSTISRSLKGLAKELNIPVLALSQLSRNVENREGLEGKRPQLSDLRESGAIEQDADMVLFVHRPEYYHIYQDEKGNDLHGMAQIIIAKHRKGSTGDVLLNFRGEFTRFQDPTEAAASSPAAADGGGEIIGSRMNGGDVLPPPPGDLPF